LPLLFPKRRFQLFLLVIFGMGLADLLDGRICPSDRTTRMTLHNLAVDLSSKFCRDSRPVCAAAETSQSHSYCTFDFF
jgi:hypothetical protein